MSVSVPGGSLEVRRAGTSDARTAMDSCTGTVPGSVWGSTMAVDRRCTSDQRRRRATCGRAARRDRAQKGEAETAPPRKQEERPAPAPAPEQAQEGASQAQPPDAGEPPRARPRPKLRCRAPRRVPRRLVVLRPAAKRVTPESRSSPRSSGTSRSARPPARTSPTDGRGSRRRSTWGDLQVELAIEDAEDGLTSRRTATSRDDADRAIAGSWPHPDRALTTPPVARSAPSSWPRNRPG